MGRKLEVVKQCGNCTNLGERYRKEGHHVCTCPDSDKLFADEVQLTDDCEHWRHNSKPAPRLG